MTLVKKTFFVFLSAFLLQIILIGILLIIGYRQSEHRWMDVRHEQAEAAAVAYLTQDPSMAESLDFPGQLAIFNANGQLVATNRGMGIRNQMGRQLTLATKHPVISDGSTVGYYAIIDERFDQDDANRALLDSMLSIGIVSLVASLFIALLAAYHFSRSVSAPADNLSKALGRIERGDLDRQVTVVGSEEIVRIGRAIESLRKRLENERLIRTQWAQDLAHDLRTPVASIKAQLEGMADGVLDPTSERFEKNLKELQRMETLIRDLEELMQLENPAITLEIQNVETHKLVENITGRFETALKEKELLCISELQIDDIYVDEYLFTRAISNIFSNAVRHAMKGSVITFGSKREEDYEQVWIHNWGDIISPDDIQKIFDRLYRGEYARASEGSGLGLTIAQRILRLHGGQITVESSKEKGTTFTCAFRVTNRLPPSIT
ncbi:MAG: HAMP domain-containing sensor histidine kinase [Sphaerochaetaceae bacterium]|jgi:two-component system sensor histidine kinase BaeS|nr:HAMP domain-containing histidine kinase [Sphaerochaetaceae bacterium]NLO60881.1 HAMP domain-containing histidine kinase [Spirochaetales bacterium]MDD2404945.1 HAMP domain-containing sensor histidine kinase [Sphaerochaetaceae bacterium]MDD4258316.1 HAMP domain-containing sensor histidine kinase [Sphaerochaetaceae bacterium]MDD4763235.1 HAMP domain-containing sensor histidine kinase [Sphaerochaetaceae bacterium]